MKLKIVNDSLHYYYCKILSMFFLYKKQIMNGNDIDEKIICISFDCDYNEDMINLSNIFDILSDYDISSSFAIPCTLLQSYSDTVDDLLSLNYEILNHTYSHPSNFKNMPFQDMYFEINEYQKYVKKYYQYEPKGFRTPHGLRKINLNLFKILKQLKLYDSSFVGTYPLEIDDVIELPVTPCPAHPKFAYDSWHHYRLPLISSTEKQMFKLWKKLLSNNNIINVFFDPIDFISNQRQNLLKSFIEYGKISNFSFLRMEELHDQYKYKLGV